MEGQGTAAQINMNDHDLLIRLDTLMTELTKSVNDIKTGVSSEIVVLKTQVAAIDQIHAEYPPKKYTDMINRHEVWIHDFKLTWKLILGISVGISSFVTGTIFFLLNALHLIAFVAQGK